MTFLLRLICAIAFILFICACANQSPSTGTPKKPYALARKAVPELERDYAAMRAAQVSDVDYRLFFKLNKETAVFSGVTEIEFTLAHNNRADVTVDFNGGEVQKVLLNDKPLQWRYNNWFITLDAKLIASGKNTLQIHYTRPYATDGDGLHRYIDSESGNQYLYSNFEPYNANRLFPHFDQPDIKARYTVDVEAPSDWLVISATRETNIEDLGAIKRWHFPKSPLISSYIFPLHAGPYHVWHDTYTDGDLTIPLRLFARQELAEHVVISDWFTFTKQSFKFFNDYFDQPYMFAKYDQLIVPDFNSGAMENLAAVTFTERFVVRGEQVESQRIRLANVIAHEMAHMWFGNLVTMDWWNGLWLNESFATYMADLQLDRASDFENTWQIFYSRTKQWAYETDQQVTTHPIELPVPTTADAFTNFDGITYGKGASVLKQLPYFIGEENFRRGVANYLVKHSYGNTQLSDFTGALADAAGMDLKDWSERWLNQAGLNSLQASYRCEDDQLTQLTLTQRAPKDHPTIRAQRIQIGLFNLQPGAAAKQIAKLPVTYQGQKTDVPVPENTACPDLVYPNLDDWGYVKVLLDKTSRRTLESHIHSFTDTSLRMMLWQGLWDSVRDIDWRLTDFTAFAVKQLPAEENDRIITQVAAQLVAAYKYYWLVDPQGEQYSQAREAIADLFWQQLEVADGGSDQQKIWFDHWVQSASSQVALGKAQALLENALTIPGLILDQDRRWALILLLNRYSYGDFRSLTTLELERDGSAVGQQNALAAEATRPLSASKDQWLLNITSEKTPYRLAELRTVMTELFPAHQALLRDRYGASILDALPQLAESKEERFLQLYTRHLLPNTCSSASVTRLETAIVGSAHLSPSLDKALRIAHQEDQRCVAIQQLLQE
jgi:aminopeptidase N